MDRERRRSPSSDRMDRNKRLKMEVGAMMWGMGAMMGQMGAMMGQMGAMMGQLSAMGGTTGTSAGMMHQTIPTMTMTTNQVQYDVIPNGTIVSLKGLVDAPDLNGIRGVIKQYELTSKLYLVELEDEGEPISVKAQNLLQHVRVTVHGIQRHPELNCQSGTVITWSPNTGRYNI